MREIDRYKRKGSSRSFSVGNGDKGVHRVLLSGKQLPTLCICLRFFCFDICGLCENSYLLFIHLASTLDQFKAEQIFIIAAICFILIFIALFNV